VRAPTAIETARLVLRRPHDEDVEAMFERYASDPEVTRFVGWPTHESLEHTRTFLDFARAEWDRWPAGPYVIASRDDETIIGSTGLAFETPYRAATGYVLSRSAWGRGYATEALRAVAELAPALGVQRLYAVCHVDHLASAHVLEKCGFLREGTLRGYAEFPNLAPGVAADVLCYARVFRQAGL
jgi:ribosomal-protein-alanine N-acetyltransferase